MTKSSSTEALTKELGSILRWRLGSTFHRYGISIDAVLTPLKWKPLVLVIGNYSSGKSTFINELLGREVQRSGQAPTDDCFTIISRAAAGGGDREVPGATVVNDERLPFSALREFGETLISHLRLKEVDVPMLGDLAIIDTPGMLDSVTEKDRGYDYLGVVGELARLADLVILMFDPHKAGTIKETYQAIRSTLPGSTGEDRILFVLNRIDECDNITDLVRSYGTLCWNLSQMTGGKDMPRIYLTFAAARRYEKTAEVAVAESGSNGETRGVEIWASEREELKQAVLDAPKMRLNHIHQEVDRGVRELALVVEAMASFGKRFIAKLQGVFRVGGVAALLVFCFGDLVLQLLIGVPHTTFLGGLFSGSLTLDQMLGPLLGFFLVLAACAVYVRRWLFPRLTKETLLNLDDLVPLETAYKKDIWQRVRGQVGNFIADQGRRHMFAGHRRHLKRIGTFLDQDLARFHERIR